MEELENHSQEIVFNEVVGRLQHNFWYYREIDPANKSLSAFANASLQAITTLPFFRQNIFDAISLRTDLNPAHIIKLGERCYQADLLTHDATYPRGYDTADAWLRAFETIENDDARSEMLAMRMLTQRVQSNIAERYKMVKLLGEVYRERFAHPPSLLDVGTSELHGPLKLAFDDEVFGSAAFNQIVVTDKVDESFMEFIRSGEKSAKVNPDVTALANKALRQCVQFGPIMGVDMMNADDPAIKQWVYGCSFYPDELRDPAKVQTYRTLEQLDPEHERVGFSQIDFANSTDIESFKRLTGGATYDIITFFTVLYQAGNERAAMIKHAEELLNEGGLIVIQDAPGGNFETPYNYTTSIIDSTRRDLGEQHIAHWRTPRCNELMLGLGKLCINERLMTFDHALAQAHASRD